MLSYTITWGDGSTTVHTTKLSDKDAAQFMYDIFVTPGMFLIKAELTGVSR